MNSTMRPSSSGDLIKAYSIISIINFVFVVFGTIGNLLTFFILMRKNLRKSYSYTRYLSALCIIDIICLYNWNFTFIYQDIFSAKRMRIEYYTPASCRIFAYIAYSSLQISSWIMCVIGIDRIILLVSTKQNKSSTNSLPRKNFREFLKKVNPFQSTLAVVIIVAVIILGMNLVVLVDNAEPYSNGNNTNQTSSRKFTCYAPVEFFKAWDIVHVLMYSLLPFLIIFVENFLIAFLTLKHSRRMKKYERTVSTTEPKQSAFSKIIKSFKKGDSLTASTSFELKKSETIKRLSSQSKGSYVKNLLIFLTLSFFFTTLPYSMIYASQLNDILIRSYSGNIIKRCLLSLQYTRHSTNFLIYILTSTIIQNEFKKCFKEIEFTIFKRAV